jgi:hypothetical protein
VSTTRRLPRYGDAVAVGQGVRGGDGRRGRAASNRIRAPDQKDFPGGNDTMSKLLSTLILAAFAIGAQAQTAAPAAAPAKPAAAAPAPAASAAKKEEAKKADAKPMAKEEKKK